MSSHSPFYYWPYFSYFFSVKKNSLLFFSSCLLSQRKEERERKNLKTKESYSFSLTPRDLSNLEKQLFFFPENLSPSQKTFPRPDENSKDDHQPTNTRIVIPTTYIFLPKKNHFSIRCLHPERFVSLSEELIFNKHVWLSMPQKLGHYRKDLFQLISTNGPRWIVPKKKYPYRSIGTPPPVLINWDDFSLSV